MQSTAESAAAMKSQGEIEAAICEGMARFEQEYMGRGPKDIRAHLFGEMLVIKSMHLAENSPLTESGLDYLLHDNLQRDFYRAYYRYFQR